MLVTDSGDAEMAALLLDRGADPNIPTAEGRTPLTEAADQGLLKHVQVLLKHGRILAPDAWRLVLSFGDSAWCDVVQRSWRRRR